MCTSPVYQASLSYILLLPLSSRSTLLPSPLTLCLLSAAGPQQGEGEVTTSTNPQYRRTRS